jgi:hypothetical protein
VNGSIYWRGRFWHIAGAEDGEGQQAGQQTGDGTGQQGQQPQQQNAGTDDKKFSQAELDAIVKDRLDRERKQSEAKAQREREAAEAKAAEEQGKFKELAEQRQTRIAELEPFQAKAERYETALTKRLEVERK